MRPQHLKARVTKHCTIKAGRGKERSVVVGNITTHNTTTWDTKRARSIPLKDAHSLAVCCGFRPRRKCRVPSPRNSGINCTPPPGGSRRHLGKGRVSRGAPVRSAVFKNYNSTPQPRPATPPDTQSTPVLHPRSCFTAAACLTPAHSLTLTRHPSSVTNHPKAESSFIRTCWLVVDGAVLPGGGKIVNAL